MEATLLHAELGDEVDPELRALVEPAGEEPET
jgi:hypothetical protein